MVNLNKLASPTPIITFVTGNHSAWSTSSGWLQSLIRPITQTFIPWTNRINDNKSKLSSFKMSNNRCTDIFIPAFLRDWLAAEEKYWIILPSLQGCVCLWYKIFFKICPTTTDAAIHNFLLLQYFLHPHFLWLHR